jgi:hypothetical protein
MIIKWLREKPAGWIAKLSANLIGALITLVVLIIFFLTKFSQVWFVVIFLPIIVFAFKRINSHYEAVGEQLRIYPDKPAVPIEGNVIIVPVAGVTRVVENSINYAKSLTDQIFAVYVSFDREDEKRFEEKWQQWQPDVRLVTLHSHYRSVLIPLSKFIDTVEHKASENNYRVTVLIPQFITKKSWHNILHNQSSLLIRTYLIFKKKVIVATLPFHFKK